MSSLRECIDLSLFDQPQALDWSTKSCIERVRLNNNNNAGGASSVIRATCNIPPLACVHREIPFLTLSPLQLSTNHTEVHLYDQLPNGTSLHMLLQMVYFLAREYPTGTPEDAFRTLTAALQYQLPSVPKVMTDQQLAQALFVPLEDFQYQFQWLCAKMSASTKQQKQSIKSLLRLVLQWSTPIQTSFTDSRLGFVFCVELLNFINHSCAPNCFITCTPQNDWQIQLYTLTNVAAGEELTISYVPGIQYQSPQVRQLQIQYWYQFQCHCVSCATGTTEEKASSSMYAILSELQLNKTDIDYMMSLYTKCITQHKACVMTLGTAERIQACMIMLRYQWEWIKMLFGRSRSNAVDEYWCLENIEPYVRFVGEAIQTIVHLMFELSVDDIIKVIPREAVLAMFPWFVKFQKPVSLSWITFTMIHFISYEMNCNEIITDKENREMIQVMLNMRWCWNFKRQWLEYYQGMDLNIVTEAIELESMYWKIMPDNKFQCDRWSRLLTAFKHWKTIPVLLKQYCIAD